MKFPLNMVSRIYRNSGLKLAIKTSTQLRLESGDYECVIVIESAGSP